MVVATIERRHAIPGGANACPMRVTARAWRELSRRSRLAQRRRRRRDPGRARRRCCPPGAARNALDCALWDLEAKRSRRARCRAGWDLRLCSRADRPHFLARDTRGDGRQGARGGRAIPSSSSSSAVRAIASGSPPCARRCRRRGSSPMRTRPGNRMKPNRFLPPRQRQASSWSSSRLPAGNDDSACRDRTTRTDLRRRVGA